VKAAKCTPIIVHNEVDVLPVVQPGSTNGGICRTEESVSSGSHEDTRCTVHSVQQPTQRTINIKPQWLDQVKASTEPDAGAAKAAGVGANLRVAENNVDARCSAWQSL
jgi:hypothetical protein